MKKLILLFLFILTLTIQPVNASALDYVIYGDNADRVSKIDSSGTVLWTYTGHTGGINEIAIDFDGYIYTASADGTVRKLTPDGNFVWSFTGHSGSVNGVAVDEVGFVYSAGSDNTVRKINSNGTQVWLFNNHTNRVITVDVDVDGNVYSGSDDTTIRKISPLGSQIWVANSHISRLYKLTVDLDGNVYSVANDDTLRKHGTGGNLIWTRNLNTTGRDVEVDNDGNVYMTGHDRIVRKYAPNNVLIWQSVARPYPARFGLSIAVTSEGFIYAGFEANSGFDGEVVKYDIDGTVIWNTPINGALRVGALEAQPTVAIEYPLTINLTSNFPLYADFIYESDFLTTTSSIVSDTILGPSNILVTSSQIDILPFVFNYWWDLDTQSVFSIERNFQITEPNRNYNLEANFGLQNSINLSLNSNLPSPPDFIVSTSSTFENYPVTLVNYPFVNEVIPFGYDLIFSAPTTNVGVYVFDYWYDNLNAEILTTSAMLTYTATDNLNLTAVYSLPDEYRIDLIIESEIGNIIFQHGNLPPISGPFISAIVGVGDQWTATAPLNENFRFIEWYNLYDLDGFSLNRSISIGETNKNYYLEAQYFSLITVYWNTLGGTIINPSKFDLFDNIIPPINNPLRPNFVFGGWALPNEPNIPITFPQIGNESITYQAIWLPTYQLTFNVNAGQPIPSQTIIENNTPTAVTPSRFGYTFDGWYTDNITFNNEFDFNDPFTSNTTIHAKWIFGTERDAGASFNEFLEDSDLDNPFAKWILVLAVFVLLNVMIFIYKAPFIVTSILNFILTALFIVLGFIPIWITIVLFMAIFGFMILMLSGGRS